MVKKHKIAIAATLFIFLVVLIGFLLTKIDFVVLNPQGIVGQKERNLMVFATLLSTLVVIPVLSMTFYIAWKYRETNQAAKYEPHWDHNTRLETVWWTIPLILIAILSVVTWRSTHALDPTKTLQSKNKAITIQVIALDWKWLFIYPEQNIASVNFVEFPVNTPVRFDITADAPMNSFWIPSLGGQIYAMTGMQTQLNLMTSKTGDYRGLSANISGKGFAGMKFTARASSAADYNSWLRQTQALPMSLTDTKYQDLAQPSQNVAKTLFGSVEPGLYNQVMMQYMSPDSSADHQEHMDGMIMP